MQDAYTTARVFGNTKTRCVPFPCPVRSLDENANQRNVRIINTHKRLGASIPIKLFLKIDIEIR